MRRLASVGVHALKERFYRHDDDRYRNLIRGIATKASDILVFGAGRGNTESDLRGAGRRVSGLDTSDAVHENPYLDEAVCYDGTSLPFPDNEFDLCCAHSVLEHVQAPVATFKEIARVLRPGGRFVFKTPNAWFYAFWVARIVPNRLHPAIVRLVSNRPEQDTFPTYYRANTRRRLREMLSAVGLRELELRVHIRGAGYLEFSLPTYLLGVLYERITNRLAILEDLRQAIVGDFVKPLS